jgi:tetratricopeptide (TPR) repeat protein
MHASKMTEALQRYQKAAEADPQSSTPHSHAAFLYLTASQNTSQEFVQEYRKRAGDAARHALALEPADPYALSVIQELEDGSDDPLKAVPAAARAEYEQAEQDFADKRYVSAIAHYQKAIDLYPDFDVAYVFLGDAHYFNGRYADAERCYRKALAINPSNTQALRFLGDALYKLNKQDEILPVLAMAVALKPNEIPSWDHVEGFLKTQHVTMQRLNYRAKAQFNVKENKLEINSDALDTKDKQSGAIWLMYAMANGTDKDNNESAFARELAAWDKAMKVSDELAERETQPSPDPTIALLRRFYHDGQLKAALLLLTFHETYRADFEAWKKENPDGVMKFIDAYHVRP